MKIFYSWQLDTPANIGKTFIRKALDLAVKDIIESVSLDDAERPEIDQDTQGISGSPNIFGTICEKIDNAHVIVSDVTLTGETQNGKKMFNNNVAIELGYATKAHGLENNLRVMNKFYGSPEQLPFDLKTQRFPIRFALSPESSKAEIDRANKRLVKQFKPIILDYLNKSMALPDIFDGLEQLEIQIIEHLVTTSKDGDTTWADVGDLCEKFSVDYESLQSSITLLEKRKLIKDSNNPGEHSIRTLPSIFRIFDEYYMGWNVQADATEIAKLLVEHTDLNNHARFTSSLAAQQLEWEARRLNSAVQLLVERDVVRGSDVYTGDGFSYYSIQENKHTRLHLAGRL